MKYLVEHYNSYYYRRKLQYVNICISLKTQNKLEANYILSIINSKIEALRYHMDFQEEIDFIKDLLKRYVDIAKEEYGIYATKREEKYKFVKPNGKEVLGSHPQAIDNAIEDLKDSVYSKEKENTAIAIIEDSNITKEEFKEAISILSSEGQQRLLDEIIKAEMEILSFDKQRNDARSHHESLEPQYIEEFQVSKKNDRQEINSIMEAISVIHEEEQSKYKQKTKEEIFKEYIKQEKESKVKYLDKLTLPLQTLLQSTEKQYLVEYDLSDFERFFQALIYTPSRINQKKTLFEDYKKNYVVLAEDFKDYLENGENHFLKYGYELELQSVSNVNEKLREVVKFLKFCESNEYIEKNFFDNNSKFSSKRFSNILKAVKERKPYSTEELQTMLKRLSIFIQEHKFKPTEIYIILIGLYTGMRVEEIAKLKTEDIKEEKGIYYFDINGEVKTKNSIRKVPLHNDLIKRFNLLEYWHNQKNKKAIQLFELKGINHKGGLKYSHYFLRDFFNFFRNSCIDINRIENDLISFHSFRHTFATRLADSGVSLSFISELLGHALDKDIKLNETPRYIHSTRLENLQEGINKLYLDDIQESIEDLEIELKAVFGIKILEQS